MSETRPFTRDMLMGLPLDIFSRTRVPLKGDDASSVLKAYANASAGKNMEQGWGEFLDWMSKYDLWDVRVSLPEPPKKLFGDTFEEARGTVTFVGRSDERLFKTVITVRRDPLWRSEYPDTDYRLFYVAKTTLTSTDTSEVIVAPQVEPAVDLQHVEGNLHRVVARYGSETTPEASLKTAYIRSLLAKHLI